MKFENKNYLLTKKIELGLEFGADSPEDFFVVFSELDTGEVLGLRQQEELATNKLLNILSNHIVEHNGYDEDGNQIPNAKIMAMIQEKSIASLKVIKEYSEWISNPFPKKTEQK